VIAPDLAPERPPELIDADIKAGRWKTPLEVTTDRDDSEDRPNAGRAERRAGLGDLTTCLPTTRSRR
jgi:hypothetical protein